MKGFHRPASDAEDKKIQESWGWLMWLASAKLAQTSGLTVGRVLIRKGKNNPRHRHPLSEEVLHLLRGKLDHSVGDDRVLLQAGDTLRIPPGVFHNAVSVGEEDAEMIVSYNTPDRDFELEKP